MKITTGKIYCMDAVRFMKSCTDAKILVDMLFTDPPYNVANNTVIVRKDCANIDLRFGDWDIFKNKKVFLEWTFTWIDVANDLLRPGGIFVSFFDRARINYVSDYLEEKYHYKMKNNYAWFKSNPAPQFRKVKWSVGWEEAVIMQKPSGKDEKTGDYLYKNLTFHHELGVHPDYVTTGVISGKQRTDATQGGKKKKRYKEKDRGQSSLIDDLSSSEVVSKEERTTHPTQKPLEVLYPIISYWTSVGDTILDPFCGVGSIPYASQELSRKWLACDNERKWVLIARKRMEKIRGMTRLEDFVE